MPATLQVGMNTINQRDKQIAGHYLTDFIKDLRDRSTPPSGFTPTAGGTLHNKTAHTTVTDRTVHLPLLTFKMASGTAIGNTSSVTVPYLSLSSSVQKITWPGGGGQIKIQQEMLVPDNYDTAADAQALKAVVRSQAVSTQVELDSAMYIIKGGSAIGTDLNPSTVALSTNGSNPEEVSLTLTYATLAKDDLISVQVFPSLSSSGADVELWGAFFQYTAEE